MKYTWKIAVLAVLVAVATVVGGCTKTVAGKPTPADSSGTDAGSASAAAPDSEEEWVKAVAAEFAKLREVDPCTLLDREVIEAVAGATAGIHLPGRHLSECQVHTDIDEHTPSWSFSVDVGTLFDPQGASAREETLDDEQFYVTSDEGGCAYTRMLTGIIAVELRVSEPITQTGGDACAIAKSYLTQAMASFTDMGRRDQELTEPQLPLATHDPCEAVAEVAQAMDTDAVGVPIKTYLCSIDPPEGTAESPLAGQDVMITYEFATDPRENVPADSGGGAPPPGSGGLGQLTAVTIAGHSGSQFDGAGDVGCGVDLVLDDQTVLRDGTLTMVQVVSVLSNDCEVSKTVAEAVITKLDPA